MLVKLGNEYYLNLYNSCNPSYEEDCDSVCGFDLFAINGVKVDGGELDYNSNQIKSNDELIKIFTSWYLNKDLSFEIVAETDGCGYEDFDELLEENDITL